MRGSSVKSFVNLVREVYARCGSQIAFASDWLFRDAFFSFFSSFKFNFNKPCITCPVLKDRETGAVFTGCPVIGLDAVSLLARSETGEPYRFDEPTAKSPPVDCRLEHIYDRLFFPGKAASVGGKLRVEAEVLCKLILGKPTGKHDTVDFGTLEARFSSLRQLEGFSSAIGLLCDATSAEGGPQVTNLIRSVADIILCMCNPQGELLQISNLEDAKFIAIVLEKDASGTLTSVFLDKHKLSSNIRGSIAELARAGLEARGPSGKVGLNSVVTTLLCEIMKTTRRALRQSKLGPDLPPIPPDERELNDPSVTLLAFNFTQNGARLRLPPRFREARKSKRGGEGGCIKKQWELLNKHKKKMGHTRGVLNIVCIRSQQSLGFLTLRDYEGRSHGPMAIYSYMPNFPRFVICDTGCQSASWCHTHLRRYFRRWRFLVDRFHHFPHKCQRVTQCREFAIMRNKNDSFVEQLHSVQRALGLTMINTGQVRAVFLLQLLHYHMYCDLADRAGVPEENRGWPENTDQIPWAPYPNDDSDSDGADDGDAEHQRADESSDDGGLGEEDHVPDDDDDDGHGNEGDDGADEAGEYQPADDDIQEDDELEDFDDA